MGPPTERRKKYKGRLKPDGKKNTKGFLSKRKGGKEKKKNFRVNRTATTNRGFKSRLGEVSDTKAAAIKSITTTSMNLRKTELEVDSEESFGDSSSEEESKICADPVNQSDSNDKDVGASPKKTTDNDISKRGGRYLLFVGNLPQTASQEDIVLHFKKKGISILDFRLLTHQDSDKSKGCGFMELGNSAIMQNALKFHRSKFLGKHINIEVTCGGGGKGEKRRKKILDKNRKMRLKKAAANPIKHKPLS